MSCSCDDYGLCESVETAQEQCSCCSQLLANFAVRYVSY